MRESGSKVPLLIVGTALVLVLISVGQRGGTAYAFDWGREGYYWVDQLITTPANFMAGLWNNYVANINASKDNEKLRQRVAKLKVQNMTMRELKAENDQLRRMLNFQKAYHDFDLVPATLLTQDISLVFKTVVINRGSRWGVHRNMPVVTPEGMLGRVVSVSPSTAQVLMITDPYSAVPAVVLRSRVKGVVKGSGRGALSFEYVRKNADIRVGDCVVTSGLSGVFPKGFKVGRVTSIRHSRHDIFARVTLSPYVAMDKVEEVFGVKANAAFIQ